MLNVPLPPRAQAQRAEWQEAKALQWSYFPTTDTVLLLARIDQTDRAIKVPLNPES